MKTPIDHQRCSELLPAFLAGELADDEARALGSHLETCAECRSERAGLEALHRFEGAGLNDDERAGLRASVRAAVAPFQVETGTAPEGKVIRLPLRDRIGRMAGIAALLLVLFVGGYYAATSLTGGGDDSGAIESGGSGPAGGGGSAPAGAPLASARPLFASSKKSALADQSEEGKQRTAEQFSLVGADRDSLIQLGGRRPFTRLAAAYTSDQIPELGPVFTDDLAGQAPSESAAEQVRECTAEVSSAATSPQLPAYATLTHVEGEPVFVLGFVYASGAAAAHPDGFTLWVYPRDSCVQPIDFVSGRIGD
jgi:hypothetical protein